jgi:hypothetical protein
MKYFRVNLLKVEGVGQSTVMTFISEVGTDINKFATKKHFTSWLRLAPNNKKPETKHSVHAHRKEKASWPMPSGWQQIPSLNEKKACSKIHL